VSGYRNRATQISVQVALGLARRGELVLGFQEADWRQADRPIKLEFGRWVALCQIIGEGLIQLAMSQVSRIRQGSRNLNGSLAAINCR
jgi:hypothetical protein